MVASLLIEHHLLEAAIALIAREHVYACIYVCDFKLSLQGNVKELSKLIISQQLLYLRQIKCF